MEMHKGEDGREPQRTQSVAAESAEGSSRELTGAQSFVAGCVIGLVVLLLVGVGVVWRGKVAERDRQERTRASLERLRAEAEKRGFPKADGSGADWSGQGTLGRTGLEADGWGNPLRYRRPGPVHAKGWDLWSCGPNGRDDQGTFDDVLVGEDVAAVSSR